jgi:hypothetical protein
LPVLNLESLLEGTEDSPGEEEDLKVSEFLERPLSVLSEPSCVPSADRLEVTSRACEVVRNVTGSQYTGMALASASYFPLFSLLQCQPQVVEPVALKEGLSIVSPLWPHHEKGAFLLMVTFPRAGQRKAGPGLAGSQNLLGQRYNYY